VTGWPAGVPAAARQIPVCPRSGNPYKRRSQRTFCPAAPGGASCDAPLHHSHTGPHGLHPSAGQAARRHRRAADDRARAAAGAGGRHRRGGGGDRFGGGGGGGGEGRRARRYDAERPYLRLRPHLRGAGGARPRARLRGGGERAGRPADYRSRRHPRRAPTKASTSPPSPPRSPSAPTAPIRTW